MYKFSVLDSVGGRARTVGREAFDQIIESAKVADVCRRIGELGAQIAGCKDEAQRKAMQDKMGEMKRTLPAFCWHATFKDGKRNSFNAIASGLVMIDVDHIEEPIAVFGNVKESALDIGLVAAHVTPSQKGLRLVFAMPDGVAVEVAQRWISERLGLTNVDGCTKDLARLSFVVPRGYWLYVDYEALFGTKDLGQKTKDLEVKSGDWELRSGGVAAGTEVAQAGGVGGPSNESVGAPVFESSYRGIPYSSIVRCLETLYGGKPEHGNRNTQIFSMACMLRYICNDDPRWIAQVLPNYGEAEAKWMSSIKSACQRNQSSSMPPVLLKAIEMAKMLTIGDGGVEKQKPFDDSRPPVLPEKLPKLIRHLIKNVPEVCRESVANGVFPALATHLSDVRFRLIDGTMKEANFMCVTMARQSSGKASINKPIEYIMADIREQDEINRRREQEWKDSLNAKGSNKEKPKRPDDLCIRMLVTDMTNAAFVQRLKDAGGKYVYTNLEELDMLKQLQTNGMKDVGKIICLCFDNGTYGQERVGNQSVTALLPLRWNWNASSTVEKGLAFFKNRLIDGTLSRINFSTILNDETKEFRYGTYDDEYAAVLKPYITNLNLCRGEVTCEKALAMARRLQRKCTEIALQTEDAIYGEFAFRAVTIAYMKAMVLYIANDMTWEKAIEDFAEWSLDYDLWVKNYMFGEAIREARQEGMRKKPRGRVNMLERLPDSFSFVDAQEMRKNAELDLEGTSRMLRVWVHRDFIVYNAEKEMYEKTERYRR